MKSGPKIRSLRDRFLDKVLLIPFHACWEWNAQRSPSGYGVINAGGRKGKSTRAHRVSWVLHRGPIPLNMNVCHQCDNPGCVNPDHLFLGSCADNSWDMKVKKRQNHKLSESEVKEILSSPMRNMDLAKKFNVSRPTISRIRRKVYWRHIEPTAYPTEPKE